MDKISIIIPVYNVELYLKKCLESVINQTYKNIEIILINDASLDNSYNICLQYQKKDKRIKIINNKKNKGVSICRNIGIKNSTGNYITFVDSDDYVEKDYIEYLYNLMIENDVDVSICGHKKEINNKNYFEFKEEKIMLKEEEIFKKLFDVNNNFTPSVVCKMYKKQLFDNIKFPENRIFEDVEVIGKILLNIDQVIYSSTNKYNYVIKKGSLSFSDFSIKDYDRIKHTQELMENVIKKYPILKQEALFFYLNNLLAVCNKQLFVNIYKSDIIKQTKKIIKNNLINILKSNIHLLKKIQIFLFLINVKLYKIVYKLCKKDSNVL